MLIRKKCCQEFDRALEGGTDNEGYGKLIYIDGDVTTTGCNLPPIKYCPWCGMVAPGVEIGQ